MQIILVKRISTKWYWSCLVGATNLTEKVCDVVTQKMFLLRMTVETFKHQIFVEV